MRSDLQRLKRDLDSGRSGALTNDAAAPAMSSRNATAASAETLAATSAGSKPASSSVVAAVKEHRWGAILAALLLIAVLAAAAYGLHDFLARRGPIPFQTFSITQLRDSGKVTIAAISPDAKYLLTVQNDRGQESMWLRDTTGSAK
jgi:hypothetical protein